MKDVLGSIKSLKAIEKIKEVICSKYFPFVTAALFVLCYYLGWDLVAIYYLGIVGIFIMLFSDDLTPLITLLLFINVIVSLKNTPATTMSASDFYSKPVNLAQIITVVVLLISCMIYRIVNTCVKRRFRLSPMFFGLCAFSLVMLLNGLFSKNYNTGSLLYGFIMAACFLGIYSVIKDNVSNDKQTFEKIAYGFVALGILLIIELVVAYITTEGLFVDGLIQRHKLIFGWGVYTIHGMLVAMCIPAPLYLACHNKHGYIFTVFSILLFVTTFLSCCRQAMVAAVIIYPACLVMLFWKGKNRLINACILATAAIAAIILIFVFREFIFKFFEMLLDNIFVDGELNGSGRGRLWKEAIEKFKTAPFLGVGFITEFSYDNISGLSFFPLMCHNTFLQLLSACGIMGLLTYVCHRVLTVVSFSKNVTLERTYIGLTILVLLITCIFDNHIFNIIPTIVYSALIGVLEKTEIKQQQIVQSET